MFDRLVALCHAPGLQPNSQNISDSLLASAELGLGVRRTCIEALLNHFLEMHVSGVSYQACCNLVWSLAVIQCLSLNTFEALLDKLTTKRSMLLRDSGPQSMPAQLTAANARKLYQALAWLRPPVSSKQTQSWSGLQSRLQAVAAEPTLRNLFLPGQAELGSALKLQGLASKLQVPCGQYHADAVLSANTKDAADVLLVLEHPSHFISNVPSRVLGYVAFRKQLVACYGTVVTIPYNPDSSTAKSMAEDIKAAVEAKTGLPLDSFRS